MKRFLFSLLCYQFLLFNVKVNGFLFPDFADIRNQLKDSTLSSTSNVRLQTAAECQTDIMGILDVLWSNASCNLTDALKDVTTVPGVFETAMDGFCSSCDIAALRALRLASSVAGNCTTTDEMYVMSGLMLDFYTFKCHKHDGRYCFRELFGDEDDPVVGELPFPPNISRLDTICADPCWDSMSTFATSNLPCMSFVSPITALCIQAEDLHDKDQLMYCASVPLNISETFLKSSDDDEYQGPPRPLSAENVTEIHELLEHYCEEPCAIAMDNYWNELTANQLASCDAVMADRQTTFMGVMCDYDFVNKEFCLPAILETNISGIGSGWDTCPHDGVASDWTTCDSQCQNDHKLHSESLGCCFMSMYELYRGTIESVGIKNFVTTCGLTANQSTMCETFLGVGETSEAHRIEPAISILVMTAASAYFAMFMY